MSSISLIFVSLLLLIPLYISYREKLDLGKDIVISMLRAVVQLLVVGYFLEVMFGLENPIYIVFMLGIMMANAAYNTKKKSGAIAHGVGIAFSGILVGAGITLAVLVLSGAITFVASEVIPVGGMIISNTMVAISLSYRSMNSHFKDRKAEVEVKLALGATPKEATKDILRDTVKVAVLPTLDAAKTLGIVSLPGMMTGLILGGASPLVAIKYQIMVTFMILSASFLGTIMVVYLGYKSFFNSRAQLKEY